MRIHALGNAVVPQVVGAALGPVVRVNKDGKVELRPATEAEYVETIGNLASTVIQLGYQIDQLKNPKKAETAGEHAVIAGPPPEIKK